MKFTVFKILKILFLIVLLSQTIHCTQTQTETEGKFFMKASLLKNKRKLTTHTTPNSNFRKPIQNTNSLQKTEAMNLLQKSEAMKMATKVLEKQDTNLDEVALKLGNQPEKPEDPAPLDLNIGTGPVWVTGWIKFFKYFPTALTNKLTPQTTPRQFMINPQYQEQTKLYPNFNAEQKSQDELNNLPQFITEKNKFYAKLLKDQLVILTERNVFYFFK